MVLVQNAIRNSRIFKDNLATIMGNCVRTWVDFDDRVARAAAEMAPLITLLPLTNSPSARASVAADATPCWAVAIPAGKTEEPFVWLPICQ